MTDDRDNPYRSPQSQDQVEADYSSRFAALRHLHAALLILFVPTIMNWGAIFFFLPPPYSRVFLTLFNAVGLLLLLAVVWYGSLPCIEAIAAIAHRFSGRRVSSSAWFDVVYHACLRLPRAAVIGATLWLAWLALQFLAGRPGGFALDVVFQIAANVVGAWVYLPILFQWYHLHQLAAKTIDAK